MRGSSYNSSRRSPHKNSRKNCHRHRNRPWNISKTFKCKKNRDYISKLLKDYKQPNAHSCGRGHWRVLPKDSCEVYKERRRHREQRTGKKKNHRSSERNLSTSSISTAVPSQKKSQAVKLRDRKSEKHNKTSNAPSASTILSSNGSICPECSGYYASNSNTGPSSVE